MTGPSGPDTEFDPERVVITDKRRVSPDGEVLEGIVEAAPEADPVAPGPAQAQGPATGTSEAGPGQASGAADPAVPDYLGDLQRVTAEYANYRKRVDRDRIAVLEAATAGLLDQLLPLLDDIARAREHGDLTGGFKGVGEGLEQVAERLGLERFGVVGEPFDPLVHEALMPAEPDPASAVATCAQVLQQGYRLRGGKVLRPARVAVSEPGAEPQSSDVPAHEQ